MNLLETTLAKTLGWTILHTLWQGTLIVVLLGVILYFLRKNTSKMRYWVAWCALMMLFISAIITGTKVYQEVTPANDVALTEPESYVMITLQSASLAEATLTWWDHMEIHFEQHLPLIVLLWTMGVLAFLLRFLGGFIYTQRMKSYGTYPVEEAWEATFQGLLARMGVHKSVRLLESTLAKSPMTIGHLKPVILMPLGSLAGLSAQQVEAILIHELAHIKRHDYVLNLIQSLIETLFFYHPAVWLMAAVIRKEREHSCDDAVLVMGGDSLAFARALTSIQATQSNYNLSMALSGHKKPLLNRIKRLFSQPRTKNNFQEGFLMACILVGIVAVFSFTAKAQWQSSAPIMNGLEEIWQNTLRLPFLADDRTAEQTDKPATHSALTIGELDERLTTLPRDTDEIEVTYKIKKDGKKQAIRILQDESGIREMYVDGEKVPAETHDRYLSKITKHVTNTIKEDPDKRIAKAALQLSHLSILKGLESLEGLEALEGLEVLEDLEGLKVLKEIEEGEDFDYNYIFETSDTSDTAYLEVEIEQAAKELEQAVKARIVLQEKMIEKEVKKIEKNAKVLEKNAEKLAKGVKKKQKAFEKELKAMLVADGFMKDKEDNFRIKITSKGLWINKKKQLEATYQKYKKLFKKHNITFMKGNSYYYNHYEKD